MAKPAPRPTMADLLRSVTFVVCLFTAVLLVSRFVRRVMRIRQRLA